MYYFWKELEVPRDLDNLCSYVDIVFDWKRFHSVWVMNKHVSISRSVIGGVPSTEVNYEAL